MRYYCLVYHRCCSRLSFVGQLSSRRRWTTVAAQMVWYCVYTYTYIYLYLYIHTYRYLYLSKGMYRYIYLSKGIYIYYHRFIPISICLYLYLYGKYSIYVCLYGRSGFPSRSATELLGLLTCENVPGRCGYT